MASSGDKLFLFSAAFLNLKTIILLISHAYMSTLNWKIDFLMRFFYQRKKEPVKITFYSKKYEN